MSDIKYKFEEEVVELVKKYMNIKDPIEVKDLKIDVGVNKVPEINLTFYVCDYFNELKPTNWRKKICNYQKQNGC